MAKTLIDKDVKENIILPHALKTIHNLPSDYKDQQLLQYCLFQNQVLHVNALDSSLYATPFLPDTDRSWRSLLCLPLHDRDNHLGGLLLIAQRDAEELDAYADSLRLLGDFAMCQLQLLQFIDETFLGHPPIPPWRSPASFWRAFSSMAVCIALKSWSRPPCKTPLSCEASSNASSHSS